MIESLAPLVAIALAVMAALLLVSRIIPDEYDRLAPMRRRSPPSDRLAG